MTNPLSLQLGQEISGKDINEWCKDQIENHGSHEKYANFLLKKNYRDDQLYKKIYKTETAGCPRAHTIVFCRV